MTKTHLSSTLQIKNLELSVNLGWRKKERKDYQPVLLDMHIRFPEPPRACETDELDDTSCYAKLIEAIRLHVAEKQFHLVEHLSADVYDIAKTHLPEHSTVIVSVTKYPKIEGLTGGVCFNYGDESC